MGQHFFRANLYEGSPFFGPIAQDRSGLLAARLKTVTFNKTPKVLLPNGDDQPDA